MARQSKVLSNQYQLNVKPIYDYMEANKLDFAGISKLIGCHDNTIYGICRERRVPSKYIFDKLKELTGKTDTELLMPLVGGL